MDIAATGVSDIIHGKRWRDARITAVFIFDLEKEENRPHEMLGKC
jgi:hypothetical protein